jgi:hypothetical protein
VHGGQPFRECDVPLRPGASPASGCEALEVGSLVAPTNLTVDPAVTERLLERLVVRNAGRLSEALLEQDEPHTVRLVVVIAEPAAPGDGVYTGAVRVVGPDDFDLDRNGDGYACES